MIANIDFVPSNTKANLLKFGTQSYFDIFYCVNEMIMIWITRYNIFMNYINEHLK